MKRLNGFAAKKGITLVFVAGLVLSIFAGCTKREPKSEPAAAAAETISSEPVTIKIWFLYNPTDDVAQKMFIDPVSKKYPNITMELIKNEKGKSLRDLVASGDTPDLIYASNISMTDYLDMDLFEDITPLAKKVGIDLGNFRQTSLDAMKSASPKGELYGLPVSQNYEVLYYNKDIFDKFGVDYPKDGMTWDDAVALAQRVTRTENGIQYMGLSFPHLHYIPTSYDYKQLEQENEKLKKLLAEQALEMASIMPFVTFDVNDLKIPPSC